MAMKRCPVCGEEYSNTYRTCPFCEEEEALRDGEEIRRSPKKSRRAAHGRQFNLITPTLVVLIFIMAGLLIYLLYGEKLAEKFGKDDPAKTPDVEDVMPPVTPVEPDDETKPADPNSGDMPEDGEPQKPDDTTPSTATPAPAAQTDYEKLFALPSGLSLSTTDFTLKTVGETAVIRVTGGSSSGSYTWASEDDGVASVDQSGKVTAISKGTINVVVSDGTKKGVCIVRCNVSGTAAPAASPTTPTTTPSTTPSTLAASGLKAGAATVVNGGNGVRVRSGPGTNYDILASVPNGADIQVVESAGNDWYKITFSDVGGVTTTGYMKGEFLQNK